MVLLVLYVAAYVYGRIVSVKGYPLYNNVLREGNGGGVWGGGVHSEG